jgi:hypothetical protein
MVCVSDIRASHDAEKLAKNPDINKTHCLRQEFPENPENPEKLAGVCQVVWGRDHNVLIVGLQDHAEANVIDWLVGLVSPTGGGSG